MRENENEESIYLIYAYLIADTLISIQIKFLSLSHSVLLKLQRQKFDVFDI